MSGIEEQFRINLNQNLWGLVVSMIALGTAEKFGLHTLYLIAAIASWMMLVSLAATTIAYTIRYCKRRT
jgi:hypothetical protein